MARRIDYLDDPTAPAATSLVPGVDVAVVDEQRALLLIRRRSDAGDWSLPGGVMERGETLVAAAERWTKLLTGLDVEVTRLVGTYTNPRHVTLDTANGEVEQECALVYEARPVGGELSLAADLTEARWVPPAEVDDYRMHPAIRMRVTHALDERESPHLG